MSTQVKHRRGSNAEILANTPAVGELWFNTTDNSIHMGDGFTPGGHKFPGDLSSDEGVNRVTGAKRMSTNRTINVPGDLPTLQDAITECYKYEGAGVGLIINLETGYEIGEGVVIENANLGFVTIQSVDATVYLSATFTGVDAGDAFATNSLLFVNDATSPVWDILVDRNDIGGDGSSGLVYVNSKGKVGGDKGVINAPGFGLYVKISSEVVATQSNFSGSGYGNRVTVNSRLSAPQANFSGTKNQFYQGSNRAANMDVSRGSLVYVTGSPGAETDLTGGLGRGLAVRRSFVSATNVNTSNVGQDGCIAGAGSVVAFDGSISSDCGQNGVAAEGSFISYAASGIATGNGNYNLFANAGGNINGTGGTFTGAGNKSVRAANGSEISVSNADCRQDGVTETSNDLSISEGSTVRAHGALGGSNLTPLSFSPDGILLKGTANMALSPKGAGDVSSLLDINFEDIATSNGTIRVFRSTSTSGVVRVIGYKGDGSGDVSWQLGSGSQNNVLANQTVVGDTVVVASATLAVSGTTGGFLPPRLTTIQRDALTPTAGLMIYNTDTNKIQVRTLVGWDDLN